MRMIHCADLHLDSKMTAHLKGERRQERRSELLQSFRRMIRYGEEQQVEAILIAGDLFDTNTVSKTAANTVKQAILDHPKICFYYLKGNHDSVGFFSGWQEMPDNLKLFSDSWNYYFQPCRKGQIVIAGAELTKDNGQTLCDSLYLHPDSFNIVMLHGQESQYKGQDDGEVIPLRELSNRGIDYLALGHIHAYRKGRLDARGTWCYPGCLEGRGFDECGEHGFVLLDIDEETGICESEFVPFAERKLYTICIDISGCDCTEAIGTRVEQELHRGGYGSKDMLKIILTGQLSISCEKNLFLLHKMLETDYYFIKIYDETCVEIDYNKFIMDESLKGEYVRTLYAADEIPEEEKAVLIRYGMQALAGEEID